MALTDTLHVWDELRTKALFHRAVGHTVETSIGKAACACGWHAEIGIAFRLEDQQMPDAYYLAEVPARLALPVAA